LGTQGNISVNPISSSFFARITQELEHLEGLSQFQLQSSPEITIMGGMVVWLVAPFPIPMAGLKRARVQVGHAIHECCHWCRGSWAGSLFGDHSGMKGDPIVGKAFFEAIWQTHSYTFSFFEGFENLKMGKFRQLHSGNLLHT
jgi:hypothetical protein